ncbi:MAG: GNAT family N-acetyltransferase, partial [Gammaproteobacteria bacterium]|nr:GNAT family N-acetyltransferase [Gammaproteobacteria bacterium]MYG66489.1 GNAT family N-acetyltransferase [Gammaproteobacteria bacterium]
LPLPVHHHRPLDPTVTGRLHRVHLPTEILPPAIETPVQQTVPERTHRRLELRPTPQLLLRNIQVLVTVFTVNYVLPDVRFHGVSKAVLSTLEAYLRTEGCGCSSLTSTSTAHWFYLAAGYVDAGKPQSWHGLTEFPMVKDLQTAVA